MPDLEHWDDHFAHVRFDGDPTEDVPSIARLSEDDKHRVAGMYLLIRGRAWVIYPHEPDCQAVLALPTVPHNALVADQILRCQSRGV